MIGFVCYYWFVVLAVFMAGLAVLSGKTLQALSELDERVSAKPWSEFSRTSFVYNTTKTLNSELQRDPGVLRRITRRRRSRRRRRNEE